MNKNIFYIKCVVPLLMLLSGPVITNAQWVPATHTDNNLGSNAYGLNCAAIDYTNAANCSCVGPQQLYGVIYTNGLGNSTVLVTDDGMASSISISYPTGYALGSIAFANIYAGTSITQDIYLGVAYLYSGGVYLDVYEISNIGTGSLSYSIVSTTTISPGPGNQLPYIDVIPEYGNPLNSSATSTPLPFCDKFIVAFLNYAAPNLYLNTYFSDFNGFVIPNANSIPVAPGSVITDASGVQQVVPSGALDYFALVPLVEPTAMTVYQWQEGTLTTSAIASYTTPMPMPGQWASIDAIKDYNIYGVGYADWDVAYQSGPPGTPSNLNVIEFSDISAPVNINTVGTFNLTSYDDIMVPGNTLAIGGGNYTIGYSSTYTPKSGGSAIAQQVSVSSATVSTDYYQIPVTPCSGMCDAHVMMASSCNTNAGTAATLPVLYTFWNHTAGASEFLYEKSSAYPVAFKSTPATAGTEPGKKCALSPNPAADLVVLSSPYDGTGNQEYRITDLTGRVLLQSAITSPSQQIFISDLATGMYILSVYSDGKSIQNIRFVKN